MGTGIHDERRVAEEAAAWLEALKTGSAEQRVAFAAWVKESPRHVRDFLLMTALDAELAGIDRERQHDTSMAQEDIGTNVVSLAQRGNQAAFTHSVRNWKKIWWAAACVAALGLMTALVWVGSPYAPFGAQRFATAIGEQRTIELDDGSMLHLNTGSQVRVRFSPSARELQLIEGEALFKVRHEPTRPFLVRTSNAVIQAIGTQFNVRRDSVGTRVSVIEGSVKLVPGTTPATALLTAGEEARIAATGRITSRAEADIEKTVAWRHRRLIFRTDTLADIAAEFNRYNRSPQIRVEGTALNRRFSGVFDADDPESLAEVLISDDRVTVEKTAEEIVIRPRE